MSRHTATETRRHVATVSESLEGQTAHHREELLEVALADSFPASDPAASNIFD